MPLPVADTPTVATILGNRACPRLPKTAPMPSLDIDLDPDSARPSSPVRPDALAATVRPQRTPPPPAEMKLLDRMRHVIRTLHHSYRTEQAYVDWAHRYILFHGKQHLRDLGAVEVAGFLTHLAVVRNVSASTQSQVRSALLFLYSRGLEIELPWLDECRRRTRTGSCRSS